MDGPFKVATPGMLIHTQGSVSFITEEGEQFKVPKSELKEVKWPFLQFGLGFTTVVNGKKYKFTFMKPNGARDLNASALDGMLNIGGLGQGVDAIASLAKWGSNKKSGKAWKALLSS